MKDERGRFMRIQSLSRVHGSDAEMWYSSFFFYVEKFELLGLEKRGVRCIMMVKRALAWLVIEKTTEKNRCSNHPISISSDMVELSTLLNYWGIWPQVLWWQKKQPCYNTIQLLGNFTSMTIDGKSSTLQSPIFGGIHVEEFPGEK